MAKMTADQVTEMAELRERGWSESRLGRRYGVTATAIHYRCLREGALSPRQRAGRVVFSPDREVHGFGGKVRRFSADEDRELLRLRRDGLNFAQIAAALARPITSCRIRLMTIELRDGDL